MRQSGNHRGHADHQENFGFYPESAGKPLEDLSRAITCYDLYHGYHGDSVFGEKGDSIGSRENI